VLCVGIIWCLALKESSVRCWKNFFVKCGKSSVCCLKNLQEDMVFGFRGIWCLALEKSPRKYVVMCGKNLVSSVERMWCLVFKEFSF